ncbi:response regulator transcription factor [Imperialibacter roseus]|jgi:DNA-binding response OmpR family regulator|uniref:Response regulator transcription factor n=1 Tax=Imperialibacter roseus TaxID=1324217 RepID=A0ABZ0IQY1_9BACT|nr:response regulator transcription factor [Imperialibacter roseus]WOK06126.1 response regulator transcription factor [Imperialibacter roseus]|tara:strand:- start:2933 stop:3619 length:687 start_codon:yes stop_codon:yes gene_type:complete
MTNVLLLEDDFTMANELKRLFASHGMTCDVVYDGVVFFKQLQASSYQLYVLDINVPSMSGIEVCKKIRETDSATPILMLTAYSAVEDKVEALEYGADDYLVKPFQIEELLARIKALLRRSVSPQKTPDSLLKVADLEISVDEMKVWRAKKEIVLTPKEYRLLELLANARGRVVSKQAIAEQVWDINFETGTNTIEVYINFLRNKVDKGFDSKLIHTRPGFGYYLKEEE